MPFNVGPLELVIVLVIALVILGPKRLPEVGKSIGNGMREFKDAISGNSKDDDDDEITTLKSPRSAQTPTLGSATPASVRAPMRIARSMLDQIVAQARAEAPNECCGMIASRDGRAVAVHPPATPPRARCGTRSTGWSSTRSRRRSRTPGTSSAPSTTRTRGRSRCRRRPTSTSRSIPTALYVIVGVAGEEDDVRAWRIVDGRVSEAALEIDEG